MAEIAKYMDVAIGNIAKIFGIDKDGINKFGGVDVPAAGGGGGDRGVFGGAGSPSTNSIDYITISSLGPAADFGDLTEERYLLTSTSNGSGDRGIFSGGIGPGTYNYVNIIDYITISSIGHATDFGDKNVGGGLAGEAACSNNTGNRGVIAGGTEYHPSQSYYYNNIEYITINSLSNSTDFGDLLMLIAVRTGTSNGSGNRGVFGGGFTTVNVNNIDYITITTLSNATNFGDLTVARRSFGSMSNLTGDRAVFCGGNSGSAINTIDYITITSIGDATDFGDLTTTTTYYCTATSNGINNRGVRGGGTGDNTIDYITISSTGDATDFGDLTRVRDSSAATSNA